MGRTLAALGLGIALLAVALPAEAGQPAAVKVEVGQQRLVTHPKSIRQVAIADPQVADVRVRGSREVVLIGRQPGNTELTLWPRDNSPASGFAVCVPGPLADGTLQHCLDSSAMGEKVLLSGESDSLPAQDTRLQLVGDGAVDASQTAFDTQVQTNIRIVEVSRNTLKQMGFTFGRNSESITFALGSPGTFSGVEGGPGTGGYTLNSDSGFLPIAEAFNLIAGRSKSGLLATLSMLEGNGLAHTLAEPSLVAMSGQSASFLAGGEFPVPVRGDNESVTVEYKEFGVRLTLTPSVLSADRIVLKVAPEVSELDFTAGVESGGVSVPALRVRRSDTMVELGDGESFAISGLISSGMISNVDKVPGLGNIPVLGAFFKSTRFERQDKELIMVVTPHVVRPVARNAVTPPLPGAAYQDYNPGTGELLFFETGRFDPRGYGFSE
ncbi:type II and III secretion system protein family protein [Thioalbus denitrificans]|uniref:Pilus assembly protein CpaC n=1 Tax=Thioalbus denitrificans TaxID=547122 RepID=A0A369C9D7_9GAMM|nr:type II and III secretion system protein family protein [Thioalbus denitrificans]RCX29778.1 pilus assembly protein CpaC [Thioalbus denitrificans]